MDLLMTKEQEMVRESARNFLEGECPPALVRKMEGDSLGYDKALWAKAAELGWQGISLPEQYGGSDLPLTYLGIILQEVGRALAPIPLHSTVVGALALAEAGNEAQRKEFLPRIVDGSVIMTWAFNEADARSTPDAVCVTAEADGDGFVLNGTKNFVDNFVCADHCLVVCRTGQSADPHQSLSVILVPTDAEGITQSPLVTTAKDKQSEVTFKNVRVPADKLVGALNRGWPIAERMLDCATALLCAQMIGAARKDAEMAIEYAKMREAFGQPIGAFQSIQHMCADMIIWIDGGDLLTFEALWKLDQNLPSRVEVSQAKSFCNEKALASARNAQIIHGGIGFMMELDLHLWYRRIASWTMRLGTTYEHRARIAQALLDYPGRVILGRPLPGSEELVSSEELVPVELCKTA